MAGEEKPSSEWFGVANDMIRSAAKWVVAAAAGVGAALIAGSQLSSIGKLGVCRPTTLSCARLPIALLGAVVGLVAVTYTVWRSVRILMPVGVTIEELERQWDVTPPRADVAFFKANPAQLSDGRPCELKAARDDAWTQLRQAKEALAETPDDKVLQQRVKQQQETFEELDDSLLAVTELAQHEVLKSMFGRLMRDVLWATAVAAAGIVAFAWAANPPPATPASVTLRGARLVGADLRDADLTNADLRDADLTNANLAGARLGGAQLKGVIWHDTTCPDGTKSTDHADTCLGHLSP